MNYLKAMATEFATLAQATGPVRVQIGKPWWWVRPDGAICLHDEAARAALEPDVDRVDRVDRVEGAMSPARTRVLDAAGALLAASTARLCATVQAVAAEAELLMLAYLPTVLDPRWPELRRANLPAGWAALLPFATAVQTGPGRFRLGGLLRGRRGSEWVMAGHVAGDRFVLVKPDALLPWSPPASAIGGTLRVAASRVWDAMPAEAAIPFQARALPRPRRPRCALRRRARNCTSAGGGPAGKAGRGWTASTRRWRGERTLLLRPDARNRDARRRDGGAGRRDRSWCPVGRRSRHAVCGADRQVSGVAAVRHAFLRSRGQP